LLEAVRLHQAARFLNPTSQNAAMIAELNEFTGLYLFSALVQADAILMALRGVYVIPIRP
jgi:hypothetical protein